MYLEDNIQRSILHLIKNKESFLLEVLPILKEEYFEFIPHKFLYRTLINYYEKYKKIPTNDVITQEIKIHVQERDQEDHLDELELINGYSELSFEHEEYFLDLLEKFAREQALKAAITKSVEMIQKGRTDGILELISAATKVSRNVNLGQDYYSDTPNRLTRINNEQSSDRYQIILPRLNEHLEGGLSRKELAMVVANSGGGKSIFLVNQAVQGLKEGRKVLYITLEMAEDKVAKRFDSVITKIAQSKLILHPVDVQERLDQFKEKFKGNLIIKEFPTKMANINTIRSYISQLKSQKDFVPDLLIIDYLELLRPVNPNTVEHLAQQSICEDIRGLVSELNMCGWTASQPNREGAKVSIITETEFADSYGKIRPLDYCISLNQTQQEKDKGEMRVHVIKSRNGASKYNVNMHVDYGTLIMKQYDIRDLVKTKATSANL